MSAQVGTTSIVLRLHGELSNRRLEPSDVRARATMDPPGSICDRFCIRTASKCSPCRVVSRSEITFQVVLMCINVET